MDVGLLIKVPSGSGSNDTERGNIIDALPLISPLVHALSIFSPYSVCRMREKAYERRDARWVSQWRTSLSIGDYEPNLIYDD